MSLDAVRWAISQEIGDPKEKLLLIVLSYFLNDQTGRCNPSRETLMKNACIKNNKTLSSRLESLVSKGLIQIVRGKGVSNHYLVQNRTTFSREPGSAVNHLPGSAVNHEPINNINDNINNVVNTTSPNFELTADDAGQKKSAVKKTRPITHSFDLKEIPEEWKTLCAKMRPDLEPFAAFAEFQFYWQEGAGASTKRSDNGWRTTWLNYLKSPRTRPTPRPTPRPQTFNRAHCLAEPAGGYTTEFYESQMSWEEMNEKRRNGEL
ncbi:helix-turn-helix domain-containing protein [Parasutterella excrementihominis]